MASAEAIEDAPPPPNAGKVETWAKFEKAQGLTQELGKEPAPGGKLIWCASYYAGGKCVYVVALYERGTMFGDKRAEAEKGAAVAAANALAGGMTDDAKKEAVHVETREDGRKVFFLTGQDVSKGAAHIAFTGLPYCDLFVAQFHPGPGAAAPQATLSEFVGQMELYLLTAGKK